MARDFDSVEEYVGYLNKITESFVENELGEFFTDVLMEYAQQEVYDVYTPAPNGYKRQYTLINNELYNTSVSKPKVGVNSYEQTIYTYSTSPHANIVVNGEPYDYDFKYNGVPRMFATMAQAVLDGSKKDWLDYQYKAYLRDNGIEAF